MFRRSRFVAIAALAAGLVAGVVAGSTGAFGSAAPADQPPAANQPLANTSRGAAKPSFQLAGRTSEMQYVPVTPCALVDTSKAVGGFGNGTTRSYKARGTSSLASQGGSTTGCGIPTNAAVIAVHVRAFSAHKTGFVKVKPYHGSGSGVGVVDYAVGVNGDGFVDLDLAAPTGAKAFSVTNSGGPAHIAVGVVGYLIAPMAAEIASNAAVILGSRVTGTTKLGTGVYEVRFDRDVTNCYYNATPYAASRTVTVEPRTAVPEGVFVEFFDAAGTAVDTTFYLTVLC